MKRTIPRMLTLLLLLVVLCWGSIFAIDYYRCSHLQMPLFVTAVETADDGGSGLYQGLGYQVDVQLDGNVPNYSVIAVTMTMFGKVVSASIV
jgi:ABC-type polysaccharide transport system permease subunit